MSVRGHGKWLAWASALGSVALCACGTSNTNGGGNNGPGGSTNVGGTTGAGAGGGTGGIIITGGSTGTGGTTSVTTTETGGGTTGGASPGGTGGVGGEAGNGGAGGKPPSICDGHEGQIFCQGNTALTCDALGNLTNVQACGTQFCVDGLGCQLCLAGQCHCEGNEPMVCDAGPPAKWVSKNPKLICNAQSAQACDEKTCTCVALQIIGGTVPTGTYYQYGTFNSSNSPFKGGYDVDSIGDTIYVNRSGQYLDVYTVALQDTDNDGKLEPHQHPDNPADQGPMEKRVLTFVKTLSKSADAVPLGGASVAELYAETDRIYVLGPSSNGKVSEYIFATKKVSIVADGNFYQAQLALAPDGRWFASNEGDRRVYSFHQPSKQWVAEFKYPNLAGSHMDGIEIVSDPNTGYMYVYVSDMTSDFLGQYRKDPIKGWVQENLFQYSDKTGSVVEGMGFGALNHFWMGGGSYLYEIGGGDLTQYLEN